MKARKRPRNRPQKLGDKHWRLDDLGQGGDARGKGRTYDRVAECWQENPLRIEDDTLIEEQIVSQWRDDGGERVPANVGTRVSQRNRYQWRRWVDADDNILTTPVDIQE